MSDKVTPDFVCDGEQSGGFSEAVCIHTDKIYDQCRDKDCLEDLRVYLTPCGQEVIDCAINVKIRKAEVIWVYSDIESVPFNRGFYSVDLKFFFKITLDAFTGVGRPCPVYGLATFDKKVILFGSEGSAKIFGSKYKCDSLDPQSWKKTNMPKAVVEVVEPIALSCKVVDVDDKCCCCCDGTDLSAVPEDICAVFDDHLIFGGDRKRVYVTIGVFSIVKLERSVQLLIPVYDFCIPEKECIASTDDNPCELFERIAFPVDEFFPPTRFCDDERFSYQSLRCDGEEE
ncbi:MAG: hypothetical protein BWY15_01579 [Firmicutes bacterium ADurb.Bin193]|nr:MAG: hypothetical protein BWY15_01579 [Firmicutes bacterium ADurb.Bin193]